MQSHCHRETFNAGPRGVRSMKSAIRVDNVSKPGGLASTCRGFSEIQHSSSRQSFSDVRTRLPDFIGIGAQRCATSWLYECLSSHPQVFMSEKELHFFDSEYARGPNWYLSHFSPAAADQICGEFTPNYLECPRCIERLRELAPDAKLIVSLRNPIDRAFSAYRLFVTHNQIREQTFEEALRRHPSLVEHGLYGQQLRVLLDLCPRRQVHVVFFSQICTDPASVVVDLYNYLQVDTRFQPQSLKNYYNVSTMPFTQGKLAFPQIQKVLARSFLGPLIGWAKHLPIVTWFKRRTAVRWNEVAAAAFAKLGLLDRFVEDAQLIAKLLNQQPPWTQFVTMRQAQVTAAINSEETVRASCNSRS